MVVFMQRTFTCVQSWS